MAILNTHYRGKQENLGTGKTEVISPMVTLERMGPLLQVTLTPLQEQLKALNDKGVPMPEPFRGYALIDTGASITCVDINAARGAGMAIVDTGRMSSSTHSNEKVPIFAGQMAVENFKNIETKQAYGAKLKDQGLVALIGRDALSSCIFIYNGSDGSFSLTI